MITYEDFTIYKYFGGCFKSRVFYNITNDATQWITYEDFTIYKYFGGCFKSREKGQRIYIL